MERYDFRTQRLFVEDRLETNKRVELERSQSNYLLNVLRLKNGAQVLLFNGVDGEWLCELTTTGRKSCDLSILRQTRPQPNPNDLVYLFAPLKQARLDYMVQKAVEMGAGYLQPVLTHHTQVTKLKTERIRANALEAAEQCGILSVPTIGEPLKLERLLSNWDSKRKIIFCDEIATQSTASKSLSAIKGEPIAVLIGPEGGFSTDERTLLNNQTFVVPISLGPRILRADTAAVAALAIVQSEIGDWKPT